MHTCSQHYSCKLNIQKLKTHNMKKVKLENGRQNNETVIVMVIKYMHIVLFIQVRLYGLVRMLRHLANAHTVYKVPKYTKIWIPNYRSFYATPVKRSSLAMTKDGYTYIRNTLALLLLYIVFYLFHLFAIFYLFWK